MVHCGGYFRISQSAERGFGLLVSASICVSNIGLVPGEQTVARAELSALVIAVEKVNRVSPLPHAEFVTDASYVCKVVKLVQLGLASPILHKLTNGDLISRLIQGWHSERFKIDKVKSHRKLDTAKDHDICG